jgi:hypothetical protein
MASTRRCTISSSLIWRGWMPLSARTLSMQACCRYQPMLSRL